MSTKIDFSKMERLTPRADSWDKVCARLDAEKCIPLKAAPKNIISIKSWYSAIPLAASFVLVSLTAILPSFSNDIEGNETILADKASTEYVSINSSAPSEVLSWYESLGSSTSDEFETLEETVGFNYLIKE
ncbi:hypothetical protein [uncultured Fibrobacter sp.]|jgi:hypothetical protein|uniref:hypothetical protein n=1 Tax=uncultured Fibrobacter sp. TaxID=261512 RepID=UPI0026146B12|nr:hypothetical protein [uncultured Fibrobacter sp.]